MSTSSNATNATATVNAPSTPSLSTNTTAQLNQTWIGPAGLVSAGSVSRNASAESLTTLLTFGPLSSCISLPDLSASPLPSNARQSGSAQQQALQEWFDALPMQRSCTPFSWKFVPDYTHHLDAMVTFQGQLEQMFPPLNGTMGGAGAGPTLTNQTTTQSDSNGSFFSSAPTSVAFSSNPTTGSTLPQGLPLWIGVTLGCVTIVHLLAFVLHVCSDLDALFPTLAAKFRTSPTPNSVLPSHAPATNQSSATLVDQPQDEQASEPPKYTEPAPASSTQGASDLQATPALIRVSRKLKRVIVPLLLLSALGMVGVAVVLNAKFAVGPVGSFSGSGDGRQVDGSGWSASSLAGDVSSAAVPLSTSSSARSTSRTREGSAGTTSNATVSTSSDDQAESRPVSPAATATPSMTTLVRRQTDFFPVASSSIATSSEVAPIALPTTPSTFASPTPTSSSTSSSAPNASLFPPITSSTPYPSSSSTSAAQPTPSSSTASAAAASTSSTAPSPFVLHRGDSTHRLWWIVILDLLLWFIQRRRIRSQTGLDKARSMVIDQLSAIHRARQLEGKMDLAKA
ncbi:RSC complex protein [Pseudozyma hubeiensis SY62]|uniref:RSC complex protein n=1 Tax=Pseudozyma hubeiensis (strain SY62) TaxID=1305764 RepID=R9P9V1_PSEHS|nr:RSC complex protein [Pseudozyma hubeiensis SY62]GAC98032.1 RSC complex protein [Pseudozyma hubeiensis SY62]